VATISDNIRDMAQLVAEVKKTYRLTEGTVMRIVDMNFAIAQQAGKQTFNGEEDLPFEGEVIEPTEGEPTEIPEGQLVLFPEPEEGDEEVLAAVAEPTSKSSRKRAAAQTKEV
jgi:hypothetical protein